MDLVVASSGVARIFRLQGHEGGARTFSSGATVECDRKCFRAASPITLKKLVNVASAEGASENFSDFSARWNLI